MARGQAEGHGAAWLVASLLLVFLGLSWVWQDIGFYDETIYLASGASVTPAAFWHGLETGPLYGVWYHLLGLVCPDPVWRYFLSWGLLVSLLVLLPVLARAPSAWLYALVLLALPVFRIWPYVSLFAGLWLVLGLLWLRRRQLTPGGAAVLALAVSAVAAFARSEHVYGVFSACRALLVLALSGRTGLGRRALAALLVLALALTAGLACIQRASDSGRSGVAFAQHYNLRAAEQGLIADDPWTSDYALRVFHVDAGHNAATTTLPLGAYAKADPARFLGHVMTNLRDPRTLVLTLLVLALSLWPWLRRGREQQAAGLYVLLVSLPPLAASLLIYPRYHYAVTILPVLVLHAVALLRCERWLPARHVRWLAALALLPMLVFALAPDLLAQRSLPSRPGLTAISCLRTLETERAGQGGLMLDPIGFPATYLRQPWRRVGAQDFSGWPDFTRWLDTARPDWVLVTPGLAGHFGQSPAALDTRLTVTAGYLPRHCPAPSGLTVYVRGGNR
ncbi:MAG: hypothetical protein VW625_04990 [Perlucidibaca sp.]